MAEYPKRTDINEAAARISREQRIEGIKSTPHGGAFGVMIPLRTEQAVAGNAPTNILFSLDTDADTLSADAEDAGAGMINDADMLEEYATDRVKIVKTGWHSVGIELGLVADDVGAVTDVGGFLSIMGWGVHSDLKELETAATPGISPSYIHLAGTVLLPFQKGSLIRPSTQFQGDTRTFTTVSGTLFVAAL